MRHAAHFPSLPRRGVNNSSSKLPEYEPATHVQIESTYGISREYLKKEKREYGIGKYTMSV